MGGAAVSRREFVRSTALVAPAAVLGRGVAELEAARSAARGVCQNTAFSAAKTRATAAAYKIIRRSCAQSLAPPSEPQRGQRREPASKQEEGARLRDNVLRRCQLQFPR